MPTLSVSILTCDDADRVEGAIASALWADEIVVADSGSKDDTMERARAMGARVVSVPFRGFGDLRNRGADLCAGDFVFSLDVDERFTPEARDEILALIASDPPHDAWRVPRRQYFMGRWIRHGGWYPGFRSPQLYRRGALTYSDAPIHEDYVLASDKPVGRLNSDILHIPLRNLSAILKKSDLYSTLGAKKIPLEKASLSGALGRGLWAFLRLYLVQGGFRDGWPGFVIALGNFEGTFYRHAKRVEEREAWPVPDVGELRRPGAGGP
jgi:glycosyltransferase involved in cell wall biosynthesis